jgi:hypothetical protein
MDNRSYSKGISWFDDCRIPTDNKLGREFKVGGQTLGAGQYGLNDGRKTKPTNNLEGTYHDNTKGLGRFPANLLVSDDMLNDGVISKSNDHKWKGEDSSPIYGKYENRTRTQVYSDKGSNSRYYDIDKWFNNLLDV